AARPTWAPWRWAIPSRDTARGGSGASRSTGDDGRAVAPPPSAESAPPHRRPRRLPSRQAADPPSAAPGTGPRPAKPTSPAHAQAQRERRGLRPRAAGERRPTGPPPTTAHMLAASPSKEPQLKVTGSRLRKEATAAPANPAVPAARATAGTRWPQNGDEGV